ncbi:MAG: endolytic transglycosylase MltG [Candidatus Abyssobacteria bacterium SURF_17]|uniref:Endolytic murein transglycosylase n=1 Tax=Candidatus Abyssobacteria bacterium SURF_17 TaxID=2093361 RepID=A0A419EY45_9BACT|nr:MAG: endolytic transglycosylase MltG [Candidatus Abyssubacteria bacterium SURF_17]
MTAESIDNFSTGAAEQPSAPEDEREGRGRKLVAIGFFSFFVLLWLLIHFLNEALTQPRASEIRERPFAIVEISPGSSLSDITKNLMDEGVISNEFLFKSTAVMRRTNRGLKAGEYRFDKSMALLDVLTSLEQGRVMLHRFTIPEGFTVKHIADLLAKKGLVDADEFLRLSNDPEVCGELGIDSSTLEGFLFPDTYKVAKGMPAKRVLRVLVDRFRKACSGEIEDEIAKSGMDIYDIVTIASIIEKEALYDDEEPLVAGVIYNRLRLNMRLQCDVTIRYPLDNYGVELTYADLRIDSPYNSYLLYGLPPTPICNPGISAIKAALKPAKTDYLYFVSMNNGRHKFSATYAEHSEAVYKYRVLNERG